LSERDPSAAVKLPVSSRPRYKRKLSNYLLDKKLQLRYVLLVTILSGLITASLGYLIYNQRHKASASVEQDLIALENKFKNDGQTEGLRERASSEMATDDRNDVLTMIGVGVGLVVVLSGYLLIMTHKVAGPLYKVSMYFDRMADGRVGKVTPLRKGDMLQDFYTTFCEMHDAVRARLTDDHAQMQKAFDALKASKPEGDYRGEGRAKLDEELTSMEQHLAARKTALA
jgi:hypothetical protein